MKDIKTRASKVNIKALDKSQVLAESMKSSLVQTKEKAEQSISADENSPHEYAADRTEQTTGHIKHTAIYEFKKQGQKGLNETKKNIAKVGEKLKNQKSAETLRQPSTASRVKTSPVKQPAYRTVDSVRTTQKGIKTADKSVKTAEQTSKSAIKTTQRTAKTAQNTVRTTAKASQKAAQTARRTARAAAKSAKATAKTIKAAAKAVAATVKAIISGTKALIAAIAAGGWIAVVVVVVICLIALIAGSCFGIFFSGEDCGTGQTMQSAVQEINAGYQAKLNETKAAHIYEALEISGSRAVWKDVVAFYAVKTTTDPKNQQEVATVDDSKKEQLKNIFWEMNKISSQIQSKTQTVIETSDDGQGNIIETKKDVTRTYLYITVSHKSAENMAEKYGFSADQRKQLSEILSDENKSMWNAVLYGISNSDGQLVTAALSQVGNTGGQPYWSWYGFKSHVEWCACFVSWCANQCGYIDSGIIPKFAGCTSQGVPWFKERGEWQDNSYIPFPGDIIFFDWEGDGEVDHVGIVEKVENGRVYTIEGNSGDTCRQNSYPLRYYEIYGYGVPAY